MEFFRDVHSVRLLGHKGRYLWADDDRRSVAQKKGQDSYGVIWRVELVPERNCIKLKSVYDLYLLASDYPFLLGATGKKVMQSFNVAQNEALEWEPIAAGTFVKLRTRGDKFLRANGGVPPYRNSVTHDVPVLATKQHVVLWDVEIVRKKEPTSLPVTRQPSPKQVPKVEPGSSSPPPMDVPRPRHDRRHSAPTEIDFPLPNEESSSPSERLSPISSPVVESPPQRRGPAPSQSLPPRADFDESPSPVRTPPSSHRSTASEVPYYDSSPSPSSRTMNGRVNSPPATPSDVRRIFYTVAEDDGAVLAHDDETFGSFLFKGHSLGELTEALQLETGIDDDIVICMRNPLTQKLYKMRLQLPLTKPPLCRRCPPRLSIWQNIVAHNGASEVIGCVRERRELIIIHRSLEDKSSDSGVGSL